MIALLEREPMRLVALAILSIGQKSSQLNSKKEK